MKGGIGIAGAAALSASAVASGVGGLHYKYGFTDKRRKYLEDQRKNKEKLQKENIKNKKEEQLAELGKQMGWMPVEEVFKIFSNDGTTIKKEDYILYLKMIESLEWGLFAEMWGERTDITFDDFKRVRYVNPVSSLCNEAFSLKRLILDLLDTTDDDEGAEGLTLRLYKGLSIFAVRADRADVVDEILFPLLNTKSTASSVDEAVDKSIQIIIEGLANGKKDVDEERSSQIYKTSVEKLRVLHKDLLDRGLNKQTVDGLLHEKNGKAEAIIDLATEEFNKIDKYMIYIQYQSSDYERVYSLPKGHKDLKLLSTPVQNLKLYRRFNPIKLKQLKQLK